jgi:protein tyrosine phosphatase
MKGPTFIPCKTQAQSEWCCLESSPSGGDQFATALLNHSKNRYVDVLALEQTRVQLVSKDYINANQIKISDQLQYIATQAPLPATFVTFWNMIWEKNVRVIVMLTKLIEHRRVKANCYWPSFELDEEFGEISVRLVNQFSPNENGIVIREFRLSKRGQHKTVMHLHYLDWPDFGTPTTDGFNTLMKLTEFYRDRYGNVLSPTDAPVVVHCSAGIGRAGTFLAISAIRDMVKHGKDINVPEIVNSLRRQRAGMVQTFEQYLFIYKYISESYCTVPAT